MDTQSDSAGALNFDGAAAAFASLLEPEQAQQQEQPQEVEAAAEDAPQDANPDVVDEAPAEEEDPIVTVKIDGKDVEVKLSELKGSYQKDKAAAQRFEQAAEMRKQAEAETQKAQAERQAYAQKLQGIHGQLSLVIQQQAQIDWDRLKAEDPVEFVNQVRLAQERQAAMHQVSAELQQVQALTQAEQAKALQSYVQEQSRLLTDKLPEWKDEGKAKAERNAIREFLSKEGFEEQALDGITDHRVVLMARKAMLYDRMLEKASTAQKKVATLPTKVERAGNGQSPGLDRRTSAYQRLDKSGRVEDAAAVFASIL